MLLDFLRFSFPAIRGKLLYLKPPDGCLGALGVFIPQLRWTMPPLWMNTSIIHWLLTRTRCVASRLRSKKMEPFAFLDLVNVTRAHFTFPKSVKLKSTIFVFDLTELSSIGFYQHRWTDCPPSTKDQADPCGKSVLGDRRGRLVEVCRRFAFRKNWGTQLLGAYTAPPQVL